MKADALALAGLERTGKIPSKETLNHPGLIRLASGLDPFAQSAEAYREAYRSLGIDLINRAPLPGEPAPAALQPGQVRDLGGGISEAYLGLYPTYFRTRFPFRTVEEFWEAPDLDPEYEELITPVPHRLERSEIEARMVFLGDTGLYYYMLYTTLFMWGVEALGMEIFLTAAALDPKGFDGKFLQRVLPKSRLLIQRLAELDSPFVFCHDDLANAQGPIFRPSWYEEYIFPRYAELWRPAKERGKQVIFVADGAMGPLLEPLKATGVDGVMLENPAADFDRILEVFGERIVIGGFETAVLTRGSPEQIRRHLRDVHARTRGMPGFVLSTPGGIHGNIPLENLEAYFDERSRLGYTPGGWRKH